VNRRTFSIVLLAAAGVALLGCEQPYRPLPYVARPAATPPILICHDAVGHITGHKPWILGGNCCCPPTRENYNLHVAQGTIDKSMSYEQYLALYREKGIVTDLDHKGCGNLCPQGPHVVLGGRCMATPTPGTAMYQRVTYGPHVLLTGADAAPAQPVQSPMMTRP